MLSSSRVKVLKKSGIIILFLLLFIVGAGAVGFYIYHNKQQNIVAVNKMPKKRFSRIKYSLCA